MPPSSITCDHCGQSFPYSPQPRPSKRRFCSPACYHASLKSIDEAPRFWAKVEKTEGCWNWTAATYQGYGVFGRKGKPNSQAHRFSYELHFGPIPDDLYVCHTCDNRRCVNPEHLWLGTNADNLRDMNEKGRSVNQTRPELARKPGEKNGNAKLTAEQVVEIRRLVALGNQKRAVARQFGVSDALVCYIAARKAWKHLP